MEIAYILSLALLIYVNAAAIFYAHASEMYSRGQLAAQTIVVLLIPFLGAMIIFMFAKSQIEPALFKKKQERVGFRFASALFLSFVFTRDYSSYSGGHPSADNIGSSDGGSSD